MKRLVYCSQPITSSASELVAAVIAFIAMIAGCAKGEDPAVTPTVSGGTDRVAPMFGVAPELVEADSRTCDLNEFVTDDDAIVAAVGKTADQIASDVDLVYETALRWDTVVPAFGDLEEQEPLAVSLSYDGVARLYPRCENVVELDMQLALSSQSGALLFAGPATLSYSRPDRYRVRAKLSPTAMSEWMQELQSVTLQEPSGFSVNIDLAQGGAGSFLVHGAQGATCGLAAWPSQRFCEIGEAAVLSDESYLGLRALDVAVEAEKLDKTYPIFWEDTGVDAQLTVDFMPDESGLACVLPIGIGIDGAQQVRYAVPGHVHLVTDDKRLDVTIPTRARTRGSEGVWSLIELFSEPVVSSQVGFGSLPVELPSPLGRAILSFSSPQEPITPQSTRIRGGIDVQVVELHSERATPKNSSCMAGNFMGFVSELAISASYVSIQP
jgi:hypothetical protein